MEEKIIDPVAKELLVAELTPERCLRHTNKRANEIYVVTWQNAPNVVREIGRLREIAFRAAGGGTGKACDLDEFDTMDVPYRQLIVWNPDSQEILGGYRYLPGSLAKIDANGQPVLATSHMFHFSERFVKDYLPLTVELGRSFVVVEYQSSRPGSRGLFTLDNLWDGLGALTFLVEGMKYFFGKMTMYPSFVRKGRDMILYFLQKHFGDTENLVTTIHPVQIETDPEYLRRLFNGKTFKEDYKILNTEVRKLGFNIPPLVNAYMGLSPTMKMFGTAINDTFGNVEETGILIDVDEIFEEKRLRHINTFVQKNPDSLDILRDVLKAPGNKRHPAAEESSKQQL